jgi:type VI secretion system secreted protein VgrG
MPMPMPMPTVATLLHALRFDSTTRLYRMQGEGALAELIVQAWSLKEELSTPWTLELSTLSTNAQLDIHAMLGQRLTLQTALADGSLQPRSGIVTHASAEDADGGFARYRLTVRPWIALLAHSRRSQVWQEQTLQQIIDSIFARYTALAQWRWADDVAAHLAQSPFNGSGQALGESLRSYTVQYRETDLAFVSRLLAEEALAWRVEEDAAAPAGHSVVLFAHSPSAASCPEDISSQSSLGNPAGGIRFHRSGSQETSDAVQTFGAQRVLQAASTTVLSWDYKAKRAVAASVPTHHLFGGPNAPRLEAYDPAGAYAFATTAQAERAATLLQEAIEARNKTWFGRATVRSFAPGSTFDLTQSPLDALDSFGHEHGRGQGQAQAKGQERRRFLLTAVSHAGINNLPKELSQSIAARLEDSGTELLAPWVDAEVRAQAAATGYANSFEAIRAHVPWRPAVTDAAGQRLNAKPTVDGPLIATVVGADGSASPSSAEQIHTDRFGRIRIRHDFQPAGEGSTWVRVVQPYAGPGMGQQFIPRVGQEVLVAFQDNDIDRPLVIGALYNGRGEGGVVPTPGGKAAQADTASNTTSDTSVFAQSSDHSPSAQGNHTGGNAPPWHGASAAEHRAGGQRNAAAMSGWKTQEFNGQGFNQLVFDDSDSQLRVQLATTQHASQLNLGHLIHQADNHRGSFRGSGFELRTDAYGTLRANQGVLLSSYATQASEAAGDNAAGIALAGQLKTLAQSFSQAAATHHSVQLAAHIGSVKAKQSALSDQEPPLQALHTSLKGMVDPQGIEQARSDAAHKNTSTAHNKLPHTSDALVCITAKAGLALAAGQDIQFAAGETITLGAGQDFTLATGGAQRIHAGQAIGVLAGAIGAGAEAAGKGITLIAGQGDIEFQAQSDQLQVAAKADVTIQSANAHIDWAAAKKIVLATAGGANVTIEGGNITVMCPGQMTVKASQKSFLGGERASYPMPIWTRADFNLPCAQAAADRAKAFVRLR